MLPNTLDVARQSMHSEAPNAAELCGRLEVLETERRASTRNARRDSYVPQHAAEDFARTTPFEMQRRRGSQALSSSPPSFGDDACQQKIMKRQSLGAYCGVADGESKSYRRSSVAPEHIVARSERTLSVDYGQNLGRSPFRSSFDMGKARHRRSSMKSGHLYYDSLPGADQGSQRISIREGVITEFGTIGSALHEDVPVLAHKITQKHLEKRARPDWTQSDENVKRSKYDTFKDLAAPFLRSWVKRMSVDNSTTVTDTEDPDRPPEGTSLPQRRQSFLARHFRKSTLV